MPQAPTTTVAEHLARLFDKHQTSAEQIGALCSPAIATWGEIVAGTAVPSQTQCAVIAEAFLRAGQRRNKTVHPEPIRDNLLFAARRQGL